VHQLVLVGMLEAQGGLAHDLAGVGDRQRMAGSAQRIHVQAVHVLHDQEAGALHLAGIHGADNVGMIQGPNRGHLALEAGHGVFVPESILGEDLDGHCALELGVEGLVDGPHTALA